MKRKKKRSSGRGPRGRPERGQRQWLPLEELSLVAAHIEAYAVEVPETRELFSRYEREPYLADRYTVERALGLYQESLEDLKLFQEQLARWKTESPSPGELGEILRLEDVLTRARKETRMFLRTLQGLRSSTIESLLEKDDLELGLEVLARAAGVPPPSPPLIEAVPGQKVVLVDDEFAVEVGEEIREATAWRLSADEAENLQRAGVLARALRTGAGPLLTAFLEAARETGERIARERGPGLVCARVRQEAEGEVDLWWFPTERLAAALFGADAATRREVASRIDEARPEEVVVVVKTESTVHPWIVPLEGLVHSLGERPVEGGPFQMPEGVEVIPEGEDGDGNVSMMVRHQELGDLGRLRVLRRSDGKTTIEAMVAVRPAATLERRRAILQPLAEDLMTRLGRAFGLGG